MKHLFLKYSFVLSVAVFCFAGCSTQQATRSDLTRYIDLEKVHAGQFDTGKMWTFDFPPMEYFARTYNFTPSKEWFEKAFIFTASAKLYCIVCFGRWFGHDKSSLRPRCIGQCE